MEIQILEPDNYSERALAIYERLGDIVLGKCQDTSKIEVLVVRLAYKIDDAFLNNYPLLKHIITPTTGLTHIDLDVCSSNNIRIWSLKDDAHKEFLESISATAELTFGLILNQVRNITNSYLDVLDLNWSRDKSKGRDLNSLVLGIVGLGRIGKKVAAYAEAFGMEILAIDPNLDEDEFQRRNVKSVHNLESLFSQSDIVSIHVHLNEETRGFINSNIFKYAKKGLILINTSRGEIINESDLLECLKSGVIKSASLDVLSNENDLKENSLIKYAQNFSNLFITPHIGGATSDSMTKTEDHLAEYFFRNKQS